MAARGAALLASQGACQQLHLPSIKTAALVLTLASVAATCSGIVFLVQTAQFHTIQHNSSSLAVTEHCSKIIVVLGLLCPFWALGAFTSTLVAGGLYVQCRRISKAIDLVGLTEPAWAACVVVYNLAVDRAAHNTRVGSSHRSAVAERPASSLTTISDDYKLCSNETAVGENKVTLSKSSHNEKQRITKLSGRRRRTIGWCVSITHLICSTLCTIMAVVLVSFNSQQAGSSSDATKVSLRISTEGMMASSIALLCASFIGLVDGILVLNLNILLGGYFGSLGSLQVASKYLCCFCGCFRSRRRASLPDVGVPKCDQITDTSAYPLIVMKSYSVNSPLAVIVNGNVTRQQFDKKANTSEGNRSGDEDRPESESSCASLLTSYLLCVIGLEWWDTILASGPHQHQLDHEQVMGSVRNQIETNQQVPRHWAMYGITAEQLKALLNRLYRQRELGYIMPNFQTQSPPPPRTSSADSAETLPVVETYLTLAERRMTLGSRTNDMSIAIAPESDIWWL